MPDITPHIIKAIPKSDRLGNLIDLIDSGTAVDPGETSEQGTPVYQVNNIAPFELLKTKVYTQRTDIKLLDKGDIVTGRVGSIGSFALFDSETLSSFSDNVLRIRIKHDFQSRLRFLLAFLNSSLTAKQIAKARKGSLQGVINQATLKTIVIPLLPSNLESNLTSSMQAEREACKRKLEQADALLASLDPFFLDQLGLPAPIIGTRAGYAIHRSRAKSANRLNADYFHPERIRALQTIHKSKNVRRAERLADIADFIRNIERVSVPSEYIGLANVQSNTGELVQTSDKETTGQCFKFRENDILFARLRPYLNKVYRAESDGVCSTEFHVLRIRQPQVEQDQVLSPYVAAILRSSIIVAQTKHMMTGNTHPRLSNDDVVNLLIPIPNIELQKKIVSELSQRRKEARQLREEAAQEWQAAKQRFEEQLLRKQ